ncbi:hypothetical protein KAX75_02205, partial [candidate division WOR-3 bacterium]|nr:hypothetical protein [candidate division WOR-3 bacterium]
MLLLRENGYKNMKTYLDKKKLPSIVMDIYAKKGNILLLTGRYEEVENCLNVMLRLAKTFSDIRNV